MPEIFEPLKQTFDTVGEFKDGVVQSLYQPINGVKQIAGQDVQQNAGTGSGAELAGQIAGGALLFIGGTMLAKKLPGIGSVAGGRLAPLAVGGSLGFLSPVRADQDISDRILHAGTSAAALALSDLGRGSLAKITLANGAAGLLQAEAYSLIDTGHGAAPAELLLSGGLWAGTAAAFHVVGQPIARYRAEQTEARQLTNMRPWQFKDVQPITATDLKAGQSLAPGHYNVSFESQNIPRSFDLYIPEAAQRTSDAPLVTFLHGLSPKGQSRKLTRELSFNRFADEDGAVVAYLHGKAGLRGPLTGDSQSWNDPRFGFTKHDPSYSDQVAFDDMMNIIRRHVPQANTDHIAVTGFSLGGKMANRIAAARTDVASVGTIHGTVDHFDQALMSSGANQRPVDALFVLGTNDRMLPINGGRGLFTFLLENAGLQRPREQATFWAQRAGFDPEAPFTTQAPQYTRRDWFKPNQPGRVVEYTVKDGAHAIDGAHAKKNLIQFLMGEPKSPDYFDARRRTWNFVLNSIKRNIAESETTPALKAVSL